MMLVKSLAVGLWFSRLIALLIVCYLPTIDSTDEQLQVTYTLHATPSAADDDSWLNEQEETSFNVILKQVSPLGAQKGFIAASLSTSDPDYYYSWTRDSALVAQVLVDLYNGREHTAELVHTLRDYVSFQKHIQDSSTRCQCLGEPKFNADGTGFQGDWGRPQNDGPAERASTMMSFAESLLNHSNNTDTINYIINELVPTIYRDLDYVRLVWKVPCFDLWEEVKGVHFFTLMMVRHAFLDGNQFATRWGDGMRARTYEIEATKVAEAIQSFWKPELNYVTVTRDMQQGIDKPSGLDVSVLMAANLLARRNDGFFTPGSDKILATAAALEDKFVTLFPLNTEHQASWLGTAIGRYPEDVYDGHGISQGNPWFLATTTYAELYTHAIQEWRRQGYVAINDINTSFFAKFLSPVPTGTTLYEGMPAFEELLRAVNQASLYFMNRVKYHRRANGSLSEQYNRVTGFEQGARDLTWSHSSFIAAVHARLGSVSSIDVPSPLYP